MPYPYCVRVLNNFSVSHPTKKYSEKREQLLPSSVHSPRFSPKFSHLSACNSLKELEPLLNEPRSPCGTPWPDSRRNRAPPSILSAFPRYCGSEKRVTRISTFEHQWPFGILFIVAKSFLTRVTGAWLQCYGKPDWIMFLAKQLFFVRRVEWKQGRDGSALHRQNANCHFVFR